MEGDDALRADVASFAANLGLGQSQTGFNDADFRKKGPLNRKVRADRPPPSNGANGAKRAPNSQEKYYGSRNQGDGRNAGSERPRPVQQLFQRSEDRKDSQEAQGLNGVVEKIRFGKDAVYSISRWGGSGEKWYDAAAGVASKIQFSDTGKTTDDVLKSKSDQAEALLKLVALEYEKSRKNTSEMKMLLSARRSGTSADKVAAMTVLIQDNPVATLPTLDSLLAMVTSKGGKRHALSGLDILKELFITSLLPDRKLVPFVHQPISSLPDTKEGTSLLLWWFWEDCMKNRYEKFVTAVIEGTKDALIYLKLKAVKTLYELLEAKPEQEKRLLPAVVNKLGDPERKAASNAGFYLARLLTQHPNMTRIVLNEVEQFIFRPNLGMRAIYYVSVFLNQLRLTHKGEGPSIARQLVDIYFVMFKTITSTGAKKTITSKEEKKNKREKPSNDSKSSDSSNGQASALDSRLISSLLTGVNKAFRFVTEDNTEKVIEEHTPYMFRLVHSSNFNVGVQALLLLHQILAKHQAVSERFYRALYSVMLSPALLKSSKSEMYLSLVFKVLRSDTSVSRTCAFIKRLMQVALHQSPELGCAFLVLLSEVLKVKTMLWNFILEPANDDDDNENFKDVELTESQESSPLEADAGDRETVESDSEIHVDDEMATALGEDDDSDNDLNVRKRMARKQKPAVDVTSSIVEKKQVPEESRDKSRKRYDPRHRDPVHCQADRTSWWELALLSSHIHPSVSTMAKTLLSNAAVVYSGDPIRDLAFTAFLDRFAEKKPKARKEGTGNISKGISNVPVGLELASLAEDDVAPVDLVFHRFYRARADAKGKLVKKKKVADDFEVDMIGSDEELFGEEVDDEDEEGDGLLEAGDDDMDVESNVEDIDKLLEENNDSEDGDIDLDGWSSDEDLDTSPGATTKRTARKKTTKESEDDDDDEFELGDRLPEVLLVDQKADMKLNKRKHAGNGEDWKSTVKRSKHANKRSTLVDDDEQVLKLKAKRKNANKRLKGDEEDDAALKRKSVYASADDYTDALEGRHTRKAGKHIRPRRGKN